MTIAVNSIAIVTNFNAELNVQKVDCNIIRKKRDLSSLYDVCNSLICFGYRPDDNPMRFETYKVVFYGLSVYFFFS